MARKVALLGLAALVLALTMAPVTAGAYVGASADIAVTVTNGLTEVVPGTTLSYTITVTNNGPDSGFAMITATGIPMSPFTSCTQVSGPTASSLAVSDILISASVTLAAGESAVFVAQLDLNPYIVGWPALSVMATNPSDLNDSNNSSTDMDLTAPVCDVSITKTDGVTICAPGDSVTYTVVVANAGPSWAQDIEVADTLPPELTNATWTAVFSGMFSAGTASGSGNIAETIDLGVGGTAVYVITADVSPSATGEITNTATASASAGFTDLDPTNNSATDVDTCELPPPPASWVGVYRLYNVKRGTHFYTASLAERDYVLRTWPDMFVLEGLGWMLNEMNNSVPLYRFYNVKTGGHFYTASAEERAAVLARWPGVFIDEGIAFFVCDASTEGAIPVFRFYNPRTGTHFYTASASERDREISFGVAQYEGIAFWLGQSAPN